MAEAKPASKAAPRAPWYAVFASRPRLLGAFLVGAVVGLLLDRFTALPAITDILLGWDAMCLVFMVSVTAALVGHGPDDIRARADREDEGRGLILALVVIAASFSVVAIAMELSLAKSVHGVAKLEDIVLAFGTVTLSWLMVQLVFALHYAHEYYDENPECDGHDMKGLLFKGDELPDYWDFVHFSVVIGVASQTADIDITSKPLRHIVTVHCMVAFVFNTTIVALTINLLAGLF